MGKAARHRRENAAEAAGAIMGTVYDAPRTAAEAGRARTAAATTAAGPPPKTGGDGPTAARPAPTDMVFPAFPYEKKFTRDEIADILARAKVMGDLMRDGVGPNGANLFIPGDLFELWMIHGVLAGADGGQAFIRSRRLPDADGRLADAVEWVVLKDDSAAARAADTEAEAEAIYSAMTENLRPEVRVAVRRMFRDKARADAEDRGDNAPMARADAGFGAPRLMHYPADEQDNGR